jgi:hypothetical protein
MTGKVEPKMSEQMKRTDVGKDCVAIFLVAPSDCVFNEKPEETKRRVQEAIGKDCPPIVMLQGYTVTPVYSRQLVVADKEITPANAFNRAYTELYEKQTKDVPRKPLYSDSRHQAYQDMLDNAKANKLTLREPREPFDVSQLPLPINQKDIQFTAKAMSDNDLYGKTMREHMERSMYTRCSEGKVEMREPRDLTCSPAVPESINVGWTDAEERDHVSETPLKLTPNGLMKGVGVEWSADNLAIDLDTIFDQYADKPTIVKES